jgi:hypothetical protein
VKRQQAQDLIASILELPHDGELQVLIDGVERLGTRFNDCAVSQNALRQQATLTLSARLEQKKTSITINALDDLDLIRRSVARVFETCRQSRVCLQRRIRGARDRDRRRLGRAGLRGGHGGRYRLGGPARRRQDVHRLR